jgi:hypothetical protein
MRPPASSPRAGSLRAGGARARYLSLEGGRRYTKKVNKRTQLPQMRKGLKTQRLMFHRPPLGPPKANHAGAPSSPLKKDIRRVAGILPARAAVVSTAET